MRDRDTLIFLRILIKINKEIRNYRESMLFGLSILPEG